ncbi:MAG: translation initiation factor IF-2 [Candidatus Vogelbacteria bacterium CG22_combo_CG10-13_8_21_14_all_37_9]|uniref:Translation initiation factor IF-2 n=1 Tax=Candidatus Vogelbacteria bacterium CG22_combo_CG10-13_8_21_14_all_37_9 TaxID=1975046 RepID=A0A2H0BLK9_9BACT|nr:MAG: translation initiation factor IF-2 [bacterium CG10_37_50]PIP58429.1 MAG: translation initiation factor IF-2 [Candidatus Vogelbacteria bacterium CG22_combo_CG10-13_8_21_14_all_37_9]
MTKPKTVKIEQNERPPIIAIMGHIDHGKSKLLDFIRQTNVVDSEAGGITQHTSAYEVIHKDAHGQAKKITFLDTPGHAAFETMRERGALICDIAVLIVSAEEGVKAQTLEAYSAIKTAGRPFIVAINKIDKTNANVEMVKQSLAEKEILLEGYGGNIPWVAISAKTGQGVDELLTMMLLVAELEELKGNPNSDAKGFVLETSLDKQVGISATLLIKDGTLNTGDYVIVDGQAIRIKKLENFLGQTEKAFSFSSPVKVYGFNTLPRVGAEFTACPNKKNADASADCFVATKDNTQSENLNLKTDTIIVPLVLKADMAGTLEALKKEVTKISHEQLGLKIVATGIGSISENDVNALAGTETGIVLGFKVKVERGAIDQAEKYKVRIETSDIIYKLTEWLEAELELRAPKIMIEETVGKAKILKTFSRRKDKQVIGANVILGRISKNKQVKIWRRETELGRGRIIDLQQQKIKVAEALENTQFGAEIDSKFELMPGDIIEVFELISK